MRILGIDYGSKRIGLALSDEHGQFAFPKGVLVNDGRAIQALGDMIEREQVGTVVIGDARSFSGIENPVTAEVEEFAARIKDELKVPVDFIWEAGSSVEASRFAPADKGHDDAAAAAIILQRYLDTN